MKSAIPADNTSNSRMSGFQLSRTWRILLLGPGVEPASEVRTLLAAHSPSTEVFEVRSYPPSNSVPKLFTNRQLSVCFIDAATAPDLAVPLIGEIQQAAPGVAIVALLAAEDPDLILRCLRRGASQFLAGPVSASQLEQVFERLARQIPTLSTGAAFSRLIAVAPVKGACGASTVALNLAFQKKRLSGGRKLLADLDALGGAISFLVSAKPSYSFLDALGRGAALDIDVWKSLVQTRDGVDLLYAPETVSEAVYGLHDPEALFRFARTQYDLILADLGSVYGLWNLNALRSADEILLVMTNDVSSVRSALRALDYLSAHRIPEGKLRIVANRFSGNFGLDAATLEQTLHRSILAALPADYDAVQRSLLEGKPVPGASAFGRSVSALADALRGQKMPPQQRAAEAPARPGRLAGFFNLLLRKA